MSNESHPSPTGSSSSTLYSGGGNPSGNEQLTQPSPAKPTWAQILNSNANAPSSNVSSSTSGNNNNPGGHNSPSSSTSSASQHSATTKNVSPSTSGAMNSSGPRSGFMPNYYDQQQTQMNWPLNFNQSSPWMMNDDNAQRQSSKSSQPTNDNAPSGGDGFERRESSSPTSDWNKPVSSNSSTANGWSNFQQPQAMSNPSRSNPNSNQWPEMNNFYGASASNNTFNLPQQTNDNNSSSTTWQDSASSATDTLPLTANANANQKPKSSINPGGNNDSMSYIPQPKLVEQLGWDEPDITVMKRANFDDGTSIWGDPMELVSVPVKKWTNGTKAALGNSTNVIMPQATVQKQISTTNATTPSASQMPLNDENWPKQSSPTVVQQSTSQWNDTPSSNVDQSTVPQQQTYRAQQSNPNPVNQQHEDWLNDGVVDTTLWIESRPPHKVPFDPYDGQIDTTDWVVPPSGGMPGQLPMARSRIVNEYDLNENPHDMRMSNFDNQQINNPYRQNTDLKNSMMGLSGILPSSHHSFPPRPNPLYPPQSGNILRPINSNGGLSTPPGAIIGQNSHLSPKLPISSPVPNQPSYVPITGKPSNIPNQSSQTPTPTQPQSAGNGNNTNNNNGAVHAQIMQQFRLAVQAGLISQDLLNTKLPPYMLQLLQKLFELQQKYQQLTIQLAELNKNKPGFPLPLLQNEFDCINKMMQQRKQEMLIVQKEIQDAHSKLKQQQSTNPTPTPSQMMSNGPPGLSNNDQSRLSQWTKQSAIGGQRTPMFPPPGLTQKDWQTDSNDPNENWDHNQANESNNNTTTNPVGNIDPHSHNSQAAAAAGYSDPFSNLVDDIDGPPPFVPGQLWTWKSSLPNAEDDPHVTPSSLNMIPKGPASVMNNLNMGGVDRGFSNAPLMHQYQRPVQGNRPPWPQGNLHDQQGFQAPMSSDWGKQQYRGISKAPPLPHPSFGGGVAGHRPYM